MLAHSSLFFFPLILVHLSRLPFLVPLCTSHSPSTPAPGYLWERNPQIPLRLYHWNKFSVAGEDLGGKQEVFVLPPTLCLGQKLWSPPEESAKRMIERN